MSQAINVAIVGATGAVGETFLKVLEEREFPVGNLYLLASERSQGKTMYFKNKSYRVELANGFDFSQTDLVLMSAGSTVAQEIAPIAVQAGAVVIDNSSAFRYDDEVPLIVPEVNFSAYNPSNKLIANPNCSTIQMTVALKPIYDAFGIERVNVATFQAVSGKGSEAIKELADQAACLLNAKPVEMKAFKAQIAFNVIPEIDELLENDYTREEMKMHWETQKIFNDDKIQVNATAVRVPVFYGHSEAIHLETKTKFSMEDVFQVLLKAPGVKVMEKSSWPTPYKEGNDTDDVYVGRVRKDITHPRGLDLWVVADNIRKGAALNAIQIAEKVFEI